MTALFDSSYRTSSIVKTATCLTTIFNLSASCIMYRTLLFHLICPHYSSCKNVKCYKRWFHVKWGQMTINNSYYLLQSQTIKSLFIHFLWQCFISFQINKKEDTRQQKLTGGHYLSTKVTHSQYSHAISINCRKPTRFTCQLGKNRRWTTVQCWNYAPRFIDDYCHISRSIILPV